MVSRMLVAIQQSRLRPQSNERQPKAIELIHKGRFAGGGSRSSPETPFEEVNVQDGWGPLPAIPVKRA